MFVAVCRAVLVVGPVFATAAFALPGTDLCSAAGGWHLLLAVWHWCGFFFLCIYPQKKRLLPLPGKHSALTFHAHATLLFPKKKENVQLGTPEKKEGLHVRPPACISADSHPTARVETVCLPTSGPRAKDLFQASAREKEEKECGVVSGTSGLKDALL